MKYLPLSSVARVFQTNSKLTKSKFWGLLAILSSIEEDVRPGVNFEFDSSKVSNLLENLFCIGNDKKEYVNSSIWYIMFSKLWASKVSDLMLNGTPNILDVAIWYFRRHQFADNIDEKGLVKIFLESIHITQDDAHQIFNMNLAHQEFVDTLYDEDDLRKALNLSMLNSNITAEGNSIVASPGELSRAPFIQTLYAGQSTMECLILTQFNFAEFYNAGSEIKHEKTDSSLQKIWFGAPGSGKSFTVNKETATTNDEGFKGLTTEERKAAYQEYLDKKNVGRSGYKGGKTNFQALTHPKLMKYISECSSYDINSLFEISTEESFNEIMKALDSYQPYQDDSITKGSDCHWKTGLNSYWDFIKEQSGKSELRKNAVFRTTFHPDYDYASFVGCYKPVSKNGSLEYSFIPQVFTKAYITAWENTSKPVYLVIEEINRGNCAQIFGDLFQLLDRDKDTGLSQYPIQADNDLEEYIESRLGAGHPGIAGGKLRLPANLHIYATMNTSDQSLFPMDSAFKRRWDWEYVPIDLDCPKSQFKITIGAKVYSWPTFLKEVNKRIHDLSDSEDKQMGNFFIKSDIDVEQFKSKVMFYLWSEVCKDYEKSGSFFKNRNKGDEEFTFNSLFPTTNETNSILQGFMEYIEVKPIDSPEQ